MDIIVGIRKTNYIKRYNHKSRELTVYEIFEYVKLTDIEVVKDYEYKERFCKMLCKHFNLNYELYRNDNVYEILKEKNFFKFDNEVVVIFRVPKGEIDLNNYFK